MKQYSFKVQGREKEPYTVIFKQDGNKLSITCTCAAFREGIICKHRTRILNGKLDNLVSDNYHEVKEVAKIAEGSSLLKLIKEIESLERRIEKDKERLSICKHQLSRESVENTEEYKPTNNHIVISIQPEIKNHLETIDVGPQSRNKSSSYNVFYYLGMSIRKLFSSI